MKQGSLSPPVTLSVDSVALRVVASYHCLTLPDSLAWDVSTRIPKEHLIKQWEGGSRLLLANGSWISQHIGEHFRRGFHFDRTRPDEALAPAPWRLHSDGRPQQAEAQTTVPRDTEGPEIVLMNLSLTQAWKRSLAFVHILPELHLCTVTRWCRGSWTWQNNHLTDKKQKYNQGTLQVAICNPFTGHLHSVSVLMHNDATDCSQQPTSIIHLHMECPSRPNSGAMVMYGYATRRRISESSFIQLHS